MKILLLALLLSALVLALWACVWWAGRPTLRVPGAWPVVDPGQIFALRPGEGRSVETTLEQSLLLYLERPARGAPLQVVATWGDVRARGPAGQALQVGRFRVEPVGARWGRVELRVVATPCSGEDLGNLPVLGWGENACTPVHPGSWVGADLVAPAVLSVAASVADRRSRALQGPDQGFPNREPLPRRVRPEMPLAAPRFIAPPRLDVPRLVVSGIVSRHGSARSDPIQIGVEVLPGEPSLQAVDTLLEAYEKAVHGVEWSLAPGPSRPVHPPAPPAAPVAHPLPLRSAFSVDLGLLVTPGARRVRIWIEAGDLRSEVRWVEVEP